MADQLYKQLVLISKSLQDEKLLVEYLDKLNSYIKENTLDINNENVNNHNIWFAIFVVKHILFHYPNPNVQAIVHELIANLICFCPARINQVFLDPDMLFKWKTGLIDTLNSIVLESTLFIVGNLAIESRENCRKFINSGIYECIIELLKQVKQTLFVEQNENELKKQCKFEEFLIWCCTTFFTNCKLDQEIYQDSNKYGVILPIIQDHLRNPKCNSDLLEICATSLIDVSYCKQMCSYLIDCYPEIVTSNIFYLQFNWTSNRYVFESFVQSRRVESFKPIKR